MQALTRAQRQRIYRAEQWKTAYDGAVLDLPPGLYTGETIRHAVTPFIGEPHHPNCWGGALRRTLSKTRAFRPLLRTVPMRDPSSHGRRTRCYRKVR